MLCGILPKLWVVLSHLNLAIDAGLPAEISGDACPSVINTTPKTKLAKRIGVVDNDHIKDFFEPLIAQS